MEIGEPQPAIIVEPVEDPFRREALPEPPAPAEPVEVPAEPDTLGG